MSNIIKHVAVIVTICAVAILLILPIDVKKSYAVFNLDGTIWSVNGVVDPEDPNPSQVGLRVLITQAGTGITMSYIDLNNNPVESDCYITDADSSNPTLSASANYLTNTASIDNSGRISGTLHNCEYGDGWYDEDVFSLHMNSQATSATGTWTDGSGGNTFQMSMTKVGLINTPSGSGNPNTNAPDNDHDGVPDNIDKCPNEKWDGYGTNDGCPHGEDTDSDHDGVKDAHDYCPNQPETWNEFKDDDGCPDTRPAFGPPAWVSPLNNLSIPCGTIGTKTYRDTMTFSTYIDQELSFCLYSNAGDTRIVNVVPYISYTTAVGSSMTENTPGHDAYMRFRWTPTHHGDVTANFVTRCTNTSCYDSPPITAKIKVDNRKPVVNAGADTQMYEGQKIILQGSATDGDNDQLTYTWNKVSGQDFQFSDIHDPHAYIIAPILTVPNPVTTTLALVVTDGYDTVSDYVTITVLPMPKTIQVTATTNTLDPTSPDPSTNVHVQVLGSNHEPLPNQQVTVRVCTLPFGPDSFDGHIHDSNRDPTVCNGDYYAPTFNIEHPPTTQVTRPSGLVQVRSELSNIGSVIHTTTGNNGDLDLIYHSPFSIDTNPDYHGKRNYISGTDMIVVTTDTPSTSLSSQPLQRGDTNIMTKVDGLVPLSTTCAPITNGIQFQIQQKHYCLFYGTATTNFSIEVIAAQYFERQSDCSQNSSSPACIIHLGTNSIQIVHINGKPKTLTITAMSLPWGGLSDINGNWENPHSTHNNGRSVDIGWGNFCSLFDANHNCVGTWDDNRILLLKDVIMANSNFNHFPNDEGGNIPLTKTTRNSHFHIDFKS